MLGRAGHRLALKYVGRPLPNAALLGAFAAITGIVAFRQSVFRAIGEAFAGRSAKPTSPRPAASDRPSEVPQLGGLRSIAMLKQIEGSRAMARRSGYAGPK